VGISGLLLNTTDTVAGDDADLDVAVVTPAGPPRVLDEPVLLAVGGAPANGEDGVIKFFAAAGVVHDSAAVKKEAGLVGLEVDSKRSAGESVLHGGDVPFSHLSVSRSANVGLRLA